jgi:peptidoglycan hydrolase CwlO-like protein
MRERIEERIRTLKWIISANSNVICHNEYEGGQLDAETSMAEDEIEFLESLLKDLED